MTALASQPSARPTAGAAPAAAAGAPPAVRISSLTKRFAVRRNWAAMLRHPLRAAYANALDDVTCSIAEGEFFGLLGPNGAGKTTLFKVLATLVYPDSGSASVHGRDVAQDAAAVRQTVGSAGADERSLYWRLSAAENLDLFARLQRIPRGAIRARVDEVLQRVGLADTGSKMAGAFSSGMRQRLLIGRALLPRPRVLLLDEPTRSLDPISARALRRFLKEELSLRQGCTVLLATHNAEEALELCDRVGILDRGRLVAAGTAAALDAEAGGERYRLWTRSPDHPALRGFARRDEAKERPEPTEPGARAPGADEWTCIEICISGDETEAAAVLASLVRNGVPVARFERAPTSLAELIERVVARHREAS